MQRKKDVEGGSKEDVAKITEETAYSSGKDEDGSELENSREKDMYSDDDYSDTVLDKKPVGGKSKDNAKYLSPYELEKEKRVKENNLVLLKQNLISPSYASITALFYLKAKKLSDITVMSVKKQLTKLGVTFPKDQSYSKEALVILLGKELFNKGKVKRIDETKVITKDNLTLTS